MYMRLPPGSCASAEIVSWSTGRNGWPDLMALGRQWRLEPKRMQLVRHKPDAPASLVLLQCRRGAKPGLCLLPDLILFHADGSPTSRYREIYHIGD